jgi:hypothetical protein
VSFDHVSYMQDISNLGACRGRGSDSGEVVTCAGTVFREEQIGRIANATHPVFLTPRPYGSYTSGSAVDKSVVTS